MEVKQESTAPALDKQKEEKYDRQLRLWGAHGQIALEHSKICLINAGATGTEILKNLVLPGAGSFTLDKDGNRVGGSFTIVDGHKVVAADLGNNFFLTAEQLGTSRAKSATELLCELNSWVDGKAVDECPVKLIDTNVNFFGDFNLVIATDLPEASVLKLGQFLYDKGIPLFIVRSYGLIGYLRIVVKEHTIIESHPEEPEEDLRLYEPFPALVKFAESFELDKLDSHHHGHVPYVVLLIQNALKWKAAHDGKVPTTREEKNEFKLQVRNGSRDPKEANFPEAIDRAYRVSTPTTVASAVRDILNDDAAKNLTAQSPNFWFLVAALRQFVEASGNLPPVLGSIPDMTADTHSFLALQEVYQNKAREDVAAVAANAAKLLEAAGRPADSIPLDDVRLFCRNAQFLRLVRTRSLAQEYSADTAATDVLNNSLDENGAFYALLRAVDRFYAAHGRYPGYLDDQVAGDIPLLRKELDAFLTESKADPSAVSDNLVHEMVRFGAAELHNIAAFLGGVASQEAIKILTRQWIPLNNTLIFNGMKSSTSVFAF